MLFQYIGTVRFHVVVEERKYAMFNKENKLGSQNPNSACFHPYIFFLHNILVTVNTIRI